MISRSIYIDWKSAYPTVPVLYSHRSFLEAVTSITIFLDFFNEVGARTIYSNTNLYSLSTHTGSF